MSYRKIITVVNEQTGSTVTARYALALASTGGAELVLYAARDEGSDGSITRPTERHLDHLFDLAARLDIPVTRITETGAAARLLPKRAQAEGADLVFYPLTPHERYGTTFQQETVHQLLKSVRADLAIMRIVHMGKLHLRHILVPLGGVIDRRERRAEFLALLAESFHAQVTLFHRSGGGKRELPPDLALLRDDLRRHHLQVLERSGRGPIAKAISLEAISHHHDLIVLGASDRGTLRRLFFGSPAGDVLLHPPCNAVMFRAAPLPT